LKRKRYIGDVYSKGQANVIVDSLLHPLGKRNVQLYIVDALLHFAVEGDPVKSAKKFLKYNLPVILSEIEGTDTGIVYATNRLLKQVMRFSRELDSRERKRRRARASREGRAQAPVFRH
jgi:hypothetical protein